MFIGIVACHRVWPPLVPLLPEIKTKGTSEFPLTCFMIVFLSSSYIITLSVFKEYSAKSLKVTFTCACVEDLDAVPFPITFQYELFVVLFE